LRFLWVIVAVIAAGAVWQLVFGGKTVQPHLVGPQAVATIGTGPDAVAVAENGQILTWLPLSEDQPLPSLPLSEPPEGGKLTGPVLQQARVLGAAPAALRPYLESSYYGETGVDVKLRSGIELRFGDASQPGAKWKAAAAVLADPSITALDYVDLHAPGRPAVGGSGHTLPPVE
jgi:cell division septal protein FtsQ